MNIFWTRERSMLKKIVWPITILSIGLICYVWLMPVEGNSSEELPFMKTFADGKVKKIAFWTTWYGQSMWGHFPENKSILRCAVNVTCHLYNARTKPLNYDALFFYGWDTQRPPSERSPHQVYIMFLHESPANGLTYVPGNTFYNWTMTYSHTADIQAPYFRTRRHSMTVVNYSISTSNNTLSVIGTSGKRTLHGTISGHERFYNLPILESAMHHFRHKGEANVFWVVSHCETSGRREVYVKALRQHIPVDIYGKCGKDCKVFEKNSSLRCYDFLARTGRYKFYLSFENSACRDYITEKVYHPLRDGLVPIVYGGLSTEEYTAMLPPGSFIDVRNFTSPKHLAEYLVYLDKDDKAYLAYHAWRKDWEVVDGDGSLYKSWCKMCQDVHNVDNVPPRNVDWGKFWNPATECDNQLLEKVLKKDV